MEARMDRLRRLLSEKKLDGLFIMKPENIFYFSGFTGEGCLFVSEQQQQLITDFRYVEQAENESPQFAITRQTGTVATAAAVIAGNCRHIGLEDETVSWNVYRQLAEALSKAELIPLVLDGLRVIKEPGELDMLRRAVAISDEAFSHILPFIKPKTSEREIALELEYHMRRNGAEREAFTTIVASGSRSALPHGTASDKLIAAGDLVTMDFGAVYKGYHSDITRTVVVGQANERQRAIYDIVLSAQQAGEQAVAAGQPEQAVDAAARDVIIAAGYGAYFGHSLGHGVGLEIHEGPRLSPRSDRRTLLAANMAVTVEPGIYVPHWGGVRIEDTVIVLATGAEILTASKKQLIEIEY